jgi:hypothetical protein
MRPFVPVADREWVQALWAATLPLAWPVLPAGIAVLGMGWWPRPGQAWLGSLPWTWRGASR